MIPDFEMIVHHFDEDITIIPLFDAHLGAKEFMEAKFREFLKMVENTPNVYLILGGDLIQNSTKSSVSNCFDDSIPSPAAQKKLMKELLMPVKDRILASVTGNHEFRSKKDAGLDPTYDILCKLDKEDVHRENVAFVKIAFRTEKYHSRPNYMLVVTHGSGGGIYSSGALLRSERWGYVFDGCDCLIVGHSHKPFSAVPGKIVIDSINECVSVKPFKIVSATSWLDYGGYAARKMLLPSAHNLSTLHLNCHQKEMVVTM